ncbi:MAG: fibronectin type III domain-containing protein, partial [Ilumatobacteraceae bacterium]
PIDSYELQANGATQALGMQTGFTWTGLTNGQPVQFIVRAHNSAGWGPWSGASAPVTPDIEPGRPAAPAVQFADGALQVSWSPPANEGSAITAYDLQIGGGASAIQRIGNTTTFRWDGLTNGQEYTFMVRAVNAKGEGQFSSASAPEHPLRPPDAPAAPIGERGDKTINVRWTPPGNNGGDSVIEYEVQILSTGAVNRTTGTSLQWSNLPNGQAQQFQVRARNRANFGPWSAASAAVVPCGVPDQTGGVTAGRLDGAATVSWAAPGNQGCNITGYTIRTNQGQTMNVGGGVTSATFTNLSNGTSYTFTVVASNEVGPGAPSAPSNAVVPAGVPLTTTLNSAVPDTRQVALSWSVAPANGSAILRYELQVNNGAWENVGNTTSTRRTGLANATTYTFRVRGVNDVGPGPASNELSARTPGEPNQVGGLDVNGGDRRVSASWSEPPDNGKPILHYQVDITPGTSVQETGRSHTFTGLEQGTTYDVRVRACNEIDCGAWSATRSATTDVPQRNVTWSSYGDAQGQPNCSAPQCAYVRTTGTGFEPGQTYNVTCHGAVQGAFSTSPQTANSSGTVTDGNACYFGYNESFWITIGGVESDHRQWPG